MSRKNTQFKKGAIPWNKGTIGVMKSFWKGKKMSTEARKKMSIAKKGQKPWSWGVTGSANPLYGKKRPEYVGKKISEARKGHSVSQETRDKISKKLKGQIISNETRKKISIASKGRTPWNTGKKLTDIQKINMSNRVGEKSSNWQGGKTPINKKIRNSPEYKKFRDDIFERDNYTCQGCGLRGVALNVDHFPVAFSVILNEIKNLYGMDGIYEMAMKFPKLWDRNNGRTLCVDCHKKTDTYLWRAVMKKSTCQ